MFLPKVRPAIAADAKQMGALHVAASRRVYAGLVPDRALDAITPAERARRWTESVAAARPDDGIFVSESNAGIVGLGHCGPQRTRTLPFPGEFFCLYVDPDTQRRGVGTALMIVMARFLIGHGMGAASLCGSHAIISRRGGFTIGSAVRSLPKSRRSTGILC